VAEQQVLATLIPGADFQVIQSLYGHDGFLLEFAQIGQLVKGFLQKHAEEEKRLYLA
jgi:homoserine O-acetyltransferase